MSPHRSALLAARERLDALERERVHHRCEACVAHGQKTKRNLVAVAVMLAIATLLGAMLFAPIVFLFAGFDMGDIGR